MHEVKVLIYSSAILVAGLACLSDLRARRISNSLVLLGICLGLGLNFWDAGVWGVGGSLAGAALGLFLFLPFFALGGMGGGDVKLFASLGALLGPVDLLEVALAAALAGGLLALGLAARQGRLLSTLRGIGSLLAFWARGGLKPSPDLTLDNPLALKIPYALPVAAGTLLVLLLRWS